MGSKIGLRSFSSVLNWRPLSKVYTPFFRFSIAGLLRLMINVDALMIERKMKLSQQILINGVRT
jgi:hypothetical protein